MEDMDRMWSQPFGGLAPVGTPEGMTGQLWQPTIDVSESIKHWPVEADLPGVKKDDIDVQVRDHSLMISAELKEEKDQPEGEEKDHRRFHRRERRFGYFERVIPLPENVDEDNITCGFKDGVLTVMIPKADTKQSGRKIAVTDGHETMSESKASGAGSQGQQANA
jgi:HSP20 family protein